MSSSFSIRNIREISNDPLTKFTNSIAKKLSRFLTKDQVDQLADNEDIYLDGQDLDSVVHIHDELVGTNKFSFSTQYFPPSEPDGDKLKLWVRGRALGNTPKDWSGFNHDMNLFEDPLLIDGTPFDYGIRNGSGFKSLALRFNRVGTDTENTEYIDVEDSSDLFVSGITTGISYFIRFRVSSIAAQNGRARTLFEKTDDNTPNNGAKLEISGGGRLSFYIKRAGTEYNWETATGTIAVDTVYDVWITYAVSGNVVKIYVNNVDKSLTAGSSPSWHFTLTDHDLSIFRAGLGSDSGYVAGDFYDFMLFREKVVSSTEVGRHYTNKWTLANIPFGQVMIANYWATYDETPALASFTTTSFTSTSFTT